MDRSPRRRLYRAESRPNPSSSISDWVRESNAFRNSSEASSRWFTDDLEEVLWYLQNEHPGGLLKVLDLDPDVAESFRVSSMPAKSGGRSTPENPKAFSLRPEKEFFVDKQTAKSAKIKTKLSSKESAKSPILAALLRKLKHGR